jgi:hypothetical protein
LADLLVARFSNLAGDEVSIAVAPNLSIVEDSEIIPVIAFEWYYATVT